LPDKFKPVCQFCKYTLGAPFWIAGAFTDAVTSAPEEMIFGEEVPLDVVGTGGTIPGDLGDLSQLRELLSLELGELGKKTF
jgi:hypothetical protein